MSWSSPVFSVCATAGSWLWAIWNSLDDAYTFLEKPKKQLAIDCLFFVVSFLLMKLILLSQMGVEICMGKRQSILS